MTKAAPSFTVVSLFAGAGGSSLGYKLAGGKCQLAVEWNQKAADAYHLNFPDTPQFIGDVAELTNDLALELTGLKPGELDILDGSPPCQGFSTSGKRQAWDPRNELYRQQVRLLGAFKPKVTVMENVAGLVKGKMRLIFADIVKQIKAEGYRVSARLMDAKYFGVPQARQRIIIIGVREDLDIEPTHPLAQTFPIGAREALEGIENKTFGPDLSDLDRLIWATTNPGDRGADTEWATKVRYWDKRKLHPRKPSPTVRATEGFLHWDESRRLTIEEVKRLQSFPDDYQLVGGYAQQWRQVGNSVPPLLMKAIAEHVEMTVLRPGAGGERRRSA